MNAERWKRIKYVLDQAIELQDAERLEWLDRECAGDTDLRGEVESLLASHAAAGTGFLKSPGVDLNTTTHFVPSRAGRLIGAYRIVELIGRGGMGEVYRATRADGQYTKEVAVKLMLGGFESAFIQERFRNERQILASLEHPNIARLIDGGTTEDGIPFLVMELIEGIRIDAYCDQQQLPLNARLHLFQQLCTAVQYAHQHLVIHRDIKPSNIMVTPEGAPKLLDFGIAKIQDPVAVGELTAIRPMTAEYASPEQILGGTISTASDIYSLGVLLFQLLTGQLPYGVNAGNTHDLARAICELDPIRPSAVTSLSADLRRDLRGDLDSIVLKALRKEPQQRYASAERLSDDIRRHLENRPISALQGSWRYRASRYVRRHTMGTVAVAAIVLAISVGIAATLRQTHIAASNAQRAERRFEDLRKLAHTLIFDIHSSVSDLPGATPTLRLLVQTSLEYLDTLAKDSAADVVLQREIASGYERLGNAQGNPFESNLGDPVAATRSFQKSLDLRKTVVAALPDSAADHAALAGAYRLVGTVQWGALGQGAAGWDNIQRAISIAEKAKQRWRTFPVLGELAMDYETRGIMLEGDGPTPGIGDSRAGLADHKMALGYFEQLAAANPRNSRVKRKVPMLNLRLGDELVKMGDRQEAKRHFQLALQQMLSLPQDTNNRVLQRDLGNAYEALGDVQLMDGDTKLANENFTKELTILKGLAAADASDTSTLMYLAAAYADAGRGLVESGENPRGTALLREAMKQAERLASPSSDSYSSANLAQIRIWLGEALSVSGPRDEERLLYQQALDTYQRAAAADRQDIQDALLVAACHLRLGGFWLRRGDVTRSEAEYAQALPALTLLARAHPYSIEARYEVAAGYSGMGDVAMRKAKSSRSPQERYSNLLQAERWYEQSLAEWDAIASPARIAPNKLKVDVPEVVKRRLTQCRTQLSL